jgi:transposase-like protein
MPRPAFWKGSTRCSPLPNSASPASWLVCLATTNVIESPNSVVRRVSGRVTNYKDAEMALRWTAAGFLEAEKSFKKLRGHADLKTLINGLRPAIQQLRKAA